jgi:flagellar biosynthesis chaperone FliJ
MKKFSFPLVRVLDWRRTQAGIEEMKLMRLHAELREIESRIACARAEQADSERDLIQTGSLTGDSLAALDAFKRSVASECARLETQAAGARKRITQQMEVVTASRRNALLLEKLGDKKFAEWRAVYFRETEQQADDAHASRRRGRGS